MSRPRVQLFESEGSLFFSRLALRLKFRQLHFEGAQSRYLLFRPTQLGGIGSSRQCSELSRKVVEALIIANMVGRQSLPFDEGLEPIS